jgi:hypothetical protein
MLATALVDAAHRCSARRATRRVARTLHRVIRRRVPRRRIRSRRVRRTRRVAARRSATSNSCDSEPPRPLRALRRRARGPPDDDVRTSSCDATSVPKTLIPRDWHLWGSSRVTCPASRSHHLAIAGCCLPIVRDRRLALRGAPGQCPIVKRS